MSVKRKWTLGATLALILIAASLPLEAAPDASTAKGCDRSCLNGFVDKYLAALVGHDASRIATTRAVKFTENTAAIKPGEGAWKTATAIGSYRITLADPQAGQTGFVGVLKEGDKATMFALRLKIMARRIVESETILARISLGGESDLAPGKLTTARPAFAQAVAPAERSSREKMIAAANSYYEGIERGSGDIVAFADDCHRIENGVALVNNPAFHFPLVSPSGRKLPNFAAMGCREQFNTHLWTTDLIDHRRFPVVDEERGLVWVFTTYQNHARKKCADVVGYGEVCPATYAGPATLDLVEMFKIRNGLIHEMESVWTVLPFGTKPGW